MIFFIFLYLGKEEIIHNDLLNTSTILENATIA